MTPLAWRDRLRGALLALVASALAHNVIFLATYGPSYGAYLARTGHGNPWTATVVVVAVLATLLGFAGAWRLWQLARFARSVNADRVWVPAGGASVLARHVVRAWVVIFPLALVLFLANENLERVAAGLPAPGLSVLGSAHYHATLAIVALVSLTAAIIDGLYRWRRDVLIARIDATRAPWGRSPRRATRPAIPWVEPRHDAIVDHRIAGRAPPRVIAT